MTKIKNIIPTKNLGFAQIPLMIGFLLMAVAIPAVTILVQKNQDNRNRATYSFCSKEKVYYCSRINQQCIRDMYGGKCFPRPSNITPTLIPTPEEECKRFSGRANGCGCSGDSQCQSTYCANSQCAPEPTHGARLCNGGETKCVDDVAQRCYCRNDFCFYKSLGVGCDVTIFPTATPTMIPTSTSECGLYHRQRGCQCINKSQCASAKCDWGQCR